MFESLGGDLVWVGIVTMIALEAGLITPPLGVSPFVVKLRFAKDGLGCDVSLSGIHMGALPFAGAALLVIALIVASPKIALILVQGGMWYPRAKRPGDRGQLRPEFDIILLSKEIPCVQPMPPPRC